MNWAEDFQAGEGLKTGQNVIIEKDVSVGVNVKIGHRVTLKSGTYIGDNSTIDDHCITTGACVIGNDVNIRTGAIISKANIIEDGVFIGPGVITNHTKHVPHMRPKMESKQLLTVIGYGSIIGTQTTLLAGVHIGPQSIIGGGSNVVKSTEGHGVYFGNPCRWVGPLPSQYLIGAEAPDAGRMYLKPEVFAHLKFYIPNLEWEMPSVHTD